MMLINCMYEFAPTPHTLWQIVCKKVLLVKRKMIRDLRKGKVYIGRIPESGFFSMA